jgi:DMSO/TMAO reductase YedYZ molybdopterin-dependent catalytic subunit
VRLQCGAPMPRGTVKWTGVRFSDFAQAIGAQSFAYYGRLVGSDGYFIDEDMTTLMHPQVVLAA